MYLLHALARLDCALDKVYNFVNVRKVGGITFIKVGRFGGSFYWSKK